MKASTWATSFAWLASSRATDTSPQPFFDSAGLVTCPASCEESGYDAGNWTRLQSPSLALACASKPKLLDFLIRQPLQDLDTPSVVRSCTTFRGSKVFDELETAISKVTADNTGFSATPVDLKLLYSLSDKQGVVGQKITAVKEIQAAILHDGGEGGTAESSSRSIVVHYGDTVAGVFIGGAFSSEGLAALPVQQLLGHAWDRGMRLAESMAVQLCSDNRTADYTFGAIVDSTRGKALYRVQQAIRAWSDAECTDGDDLAFTSTKDFGQSTVWHTKPEEAARLLVNTTIPATVPDTKPALLSARANCRTRQVISGDTCASLATKCGISGTDITKFNQAQNFCATLKVDQHICCSSGTLPDVRPKPLADGTCANYVVKSGDWCDKIASANGLTVSDLESLNQKTWGWSGCGLLYVGIRMCLSKGTPPLPAPIANAVCGPQKPGTTKPPAGTDLATLNPCLLNACCNVWGQCGTTVEFCTKSSLGPPGTSEPGKSGCISNCGMGVTNIVRPSSFMKVGYFEGWNLERPCLHMDVSQIPSSYTHIHFAFGDILPDFSVSVSRVNDQFQKFVKMKGTKRIIAFGGWTASTDSTTFHIYRDGVKPENRERLSTNLAKFVVDNGLDGLDIDWEYPGAPDIPGIPKGDPIDGPRYVELLKLLRKKLPSDKTLSIAAPASFWYLKQFPIKDIVPVVDYIIYMTYDLHGQWDYGNQWAAPGCPTGNCLRSHINFTETYNALSMVTKAGASTNKIIVGVTSYGRSFRMVDPKCTGPMCKFTGPASGATAGRCTGTPGYLADAEIRDILKNDASARTFFDPIEATNVLTYGSNWVAYMDATNKAYREAFWRDFGFGGTTDWAIDLDAFLPSTVTPGPQPPTTGPGIHFEDITCDHKLANDGNALPVDRWKTLKAGDSWTYALDRWDKRRDGMSQVFPAFVSNLFNGGENFLCQKTQDFGTCTGSVQCILHYNAGGYLVLRSFAAVADTLVAFYNGIESANLQVVTYLDKFASVFAPPEEEDKKLEFIFTFISLGIGLAAGPVFSKLFAANAFFKEHENTAETLQETVMGLVDFGMGKAQEDLSKIAPALTKDVNGEVSTQLGQVVFAWKTLVTMMQSSLFSGSKDTRGTLFKLINEGKLLSLNIPSKLEIETRVAKVFYAALIPYAWSLRQHSPVLVNTGWDCNTVGGGDYEFLNPESNEDSKVCVDGKQYFLLSVPWSLTARKCPNSNRPDFVICEPNPLATLPGVETLGVEWDGKDKVGEGTQYKWGGVKRDDFAKSIISRYNKNGNRDLDKFPDSSSDTVKGNIWEVIQNDEFTILPGLVNIPMCGPDEVSKNWVRRGYKSGHQWPGFPCNQA